MARTLVYSLLLLCASWALAQNNPRPSSSAATQAGSMADNKTTVQGCLNGAAGSFSLTDQSGNTYQLGGDTSKLNEHVGHKVEITGTTASASAGSAGGRSTTSSGAGSQQFLNVSSVKHVSDSCNPSR